MTDDTVTDDGIDPRAGELTTQYYGWTKPTVGGSQDIWGGFLNADLDGIDLIIHNLSTSLPIATTITPKINGTAAIGSDTAWAKGDHVHPVDTSRASTTGITDGSLATAGQVGEFVTATQSTATSMTTAVAMNVTSISLTAGDWDVDGDVYMISSAAVGQGMGASVSLTSAAMAGVAGPARTQLAVAVGSPNLAVGNLATGRLRVNVSTTTTVYLVAVASFGSGTCTAQGTIQARRMR